MLRLKIQPSSVKNTQAWLHLEKKERKDLHRVDVLRGYKTINERISRITETRWTLDNDMRKKARGTSVLIDHF